MQMTLYAAIIYKDTQFIMSKSSDKAVKICVSIYVREKLAAKSLYLRKCVCIAIAVTCQTVRSPPKT